MYVSYSWVSSMENRIDTAEEWSAKARACFERIKDSFAEKEKDALEAQVLFSDLNVAVAKMDVERVFQDLDMLGVLKLSEPVLLGELNWNEPSLLKTAYGFKGKLSLDEKYLMLMDRLPRLIGSFAAYMAVIVAEFYYERDRLDELAGILAKNMGNITEMGLPGIIVPAFILLAKSKQAKGDVTGAFHDIEEARKLLGAGAGSVWSYHLDICTAALHLRLWDAGRAAKYIDTGRIGLYDPLSSMREYEYIVYARYLLAANRPDDALTLLGRLSNFANQENQLGLQIEILCLEALSSDMKGNLSGALTALGWAFSLGADEGYVRTFADEGEPMAALLEKYISVSGGNSRYLDYAESLLGSACEYAELLRKKAHFQKSGLGSLLTGRELEVLRLLAEKIPNEEIASRLFFSVSAVKWYNTKIYEKLGVKNRHDAIEKAKELGLIE
jgi:LuxR family maltose regulon positive regulatory protein